MKRRLPMGVSRAGRAGPRDQRGFTILEVLVALALFGVVALATTAAFSSALRGMIAGRQFADEQQNARLALEWMHRRIRMAGVGAPAGTTEFVTEAAANAVAFRGDIGGSGWVARRYCLDTSQGVVMEQVDAQVSADCTSGAPITSRGIRPLRVVRLVFAYFTGQDVALTPLPLTATTQRSLVARVEITLGLDTNRSGAYEMTDDLTFTMNAVIRNY